MDRFMFLELVVIVIVVLFRVHDLIVAAPNTRVVIRTNDPLSPPRRQTLIQIVAATARMKPLLMRTLYSC